MRAGRLGAFASLRRQVDLKGEWGCEGRVPFGYLTHVMGKGLELGSADPVLQSIREVKETSELRLLREAAKILGKAFLKVPELMKEGMTEIELSGALREEIFALGGEAVDFCTCRPGRTRPTRTGLPPRGRLRRGSGS